MLRARYYTRRTRRKSVLEVRASENKSPQNYEKIKSLGEGTYGTVALYQSVTNPQDQVVGKKFLPGKTSIPKIKAENKKNLAVHGFSFALSAEEEKDMHILFTPYFEGPILSHYKFKSEEEMIKIFIKIFMKFYKMHTLLKIVHCDIKGNNIIIMGDQIIIIDFGNATRCGEKKIAYEISAEKYQKFIDTWPPELAGEKGVIKFVNASPLMDVYNLGKLLSENLSSFFPELWKNPELKNLIIHMTQYRMDERINLYEATRQLMEIYNQLFPEHPKFDPALAIYDDLNDGCITTVDSINKYTVKKATDLETKKIPSLQGQKKITKPAVDQKVRGDSPSLDKTDRHIPLPTLENSTNEKFDRPPALEHASPKPPPPPPPETPLCPASPRNSYAELKDILSPSSKAKHLMRTSTPSSEAALPASPPKRSDDLKGHPSQPAKTGSTKKIDGKPAAVFEFFRKKTTKPKKKPPTLSAFGRLSRFIRSKKLSSKQSATSTQPSTQAKQ